MFGSFTWEQREFGELLKEFSIKSKVEDEHTVLSSTNSGMEVRDGRVSGTSNLGYKIIENEDLVLSPQNLWIGNINVNDIGIGLVSPSYKTFKFVSVFGSFIEPQLRMPRLMEKYKNASTQGASVVRRNLELDSFYQITIRVPKSDEQRKIGDFFRQLDDLITLHQRMLLLFFIAVYISLDNDLITKSVSWFSSSCMICKYVFCVVVILACPNLRATLAIETPANKSNDACVCLSP